METEGGPAVGMYPPVGWANSVTPSFAAVKCGNIVQTETFTTVGFEPRTIGFLAPATWSDTESFTTSDPSGIIWDCNTTGIYSLRFTQHLRITNPTPAAAVPVVIPNSRFYLNLDATGLATQYGTADLIAKNLTPAPSQSSDYSSAGSESNVLMSAFVTPVGFLSSTVIPGGTWRFSQSVNTDDTTEGNTIYAQIYSVDADGTSNPVLIVNGISSPQTLPAGPYNAVWEVSAAPIILTDLTKRIQIRIYANFTVESNLSVFYEGDTISSVWTPISQSIPSAGITTVKDTVNMRMTIASPTSEFNQVLEASIPVSVAGDEVIVYTNSVSGIVNVDAGSSLICEIVAEKGTTQVESGFAFLPAPVCNLQWNLIAQGEYGNVGLIV